MHRYGPSTPNLRTVKRFRVCVRNSLKGISNVRQFFVPWKRKCNTRACSKSCSKISDDYCPGKISLAKMFVVFCYWIKKILIRFWAHSGAFRDNLNLILLSTILFPKNNFSSSRITFWSNIWSRCEIRSNYFYEVLVFYISTKQNNFVRFKQCLILIRYGNTVKGRIN